MQISLALSPANPLITGAGYNTDALALFSRMSSQPPPRVKRSISNLFDGLKAIGYPLTASGPWDAFYWVTSNAADALLNWVSSSYPLVPQNSPVATPYRGFQGNGSTSYYSTGFNPSAAGGKHVQDSAHMFIWSLTDATGSTADDAGNTNTRINSKGSSTPFVRCNSGSITNPSVSDSLGFSAVSRTASAGFRFHKNGAAGSSITGTSIAPANAEFTLCKVNTNYSARSIAGFGFGSGISDAGMQAIYGVLAIFAQDMQSFFLTA